MSIQTTQTIYRIWTALALSFLLCLSGNVSAAEAGSTPSELDRLISVLQDDEARLKLLDALQQGQTLPDTADTSELEHEGVAVAEEESVSAARRIANLSQSVAQGLVDDFSGGIGALRAVSSGSMQFDMAAVTTALTQLAFLIVATLVVFFLLRRLLRPLFAKINRWCASDGAQPSLLRRGSAIIAAAFLDLLAVILAWVGGYALALFVIGDTGAMDPRESLFLNAFLLVEVFKVALRTLFAAKDDQLRIMPIPPEDAAYWNAWLARISGFMGYGLLLIVPMINFNLSHQLGWMVSAVIVGLAFIYALAIITQNRDSVADGLQRRANAADMALSRVLLGMLSRSWHLLAIAYVALVAFAGLIRPDDLLPMVLIGTVESLAAIGLGFFVTALLSQLIRQQLVLPKDTKERFPMLESRLNGFVPKAINALKLVVFAIVLMVIADAWGMFNVMDWLASEPGRTTLGSVISVAVILLLASVMWIGLASWIEQRLNPNTGSGEPSAREITLLTIFRNALAVLLIIMTTMIVLSEIGINIGPLIAGAGVLGLAIGFGAQKLVQDVITGVFIQLENAINTGDIITAGGVTGTAEKLTIRSLSIRDLSGTYHLIPFSSVDTVSNYMRDFAYHVGVYGVAYRENTDEVIVLLRNAFDELIADDDNRLKIIDGLEVHGVTALGDSSVDIRIRIKTLPGSQWAIGRAYNRLVKKHLDAAGVEIPFPHMTLYFGQDKDGSAPPAPVMLQGQARQLSGPSDSANTSERSKTNAKQNEDYDDADD